MSAPCLLPFTRESAELSVHRPYLPELASDNIYTLPIAPCPTQYDGGLPSHLAPPLGACGEQGQQSEGEMTWQDLFSIPELQGLVTDGDITTEPPTYSGPSYPPPLDAYCLPGAAQPWNGHSFALVPGGYATPYSGPQGCPLGGGGAGFESCCLSLLEAPGPTYYKTREDLGSDSGLSLDSSPNAGSEGYGGGEPQGWGPWGPAPEMPAPRLGPAPGGPGSRGKRESSSRDSRRAQALRIPLATEAIVNLPVDDFNELVSRHRLSEQQLALARDIRRRGKNKVAAQNCRQRKLENIARLGGELGGLRAERQRLVGEREEVGQQLRQAERRVAMLAHRVFAALRDPQGLPYSPDEFSLRQTPDGAVYLEPCGAGGREGVGGD
ncbi:transcription factor NF-E2 45 kDa subunit-like [Scyliorhinus canicula]|uniref:transcription factor NF-E2 45 kDa subunit-like n=1 Tax=Scyliorhinus canicula TaxID=7830 RepID=UPI0018F7675F|nr:transcription factor NF-E2 45 kDa subunit-like [Scyliorhinus canicula]